MSLDIQCDFWFLELKIYKILKNVIFRRQILFPDYITNQTLGKNGFSAILKFK